MKMIGAVNLRLIQMKDNWFSNFKPFDKPMRYGDYDYVTPEHFYQAQKTKDKKQQKAIATAKTPGKAKKLGRKCKMVKNWEDIKIDVMEYALWYKFRKGTLMHKKLLNIKGEIVEWNNWHDNEWGNCICSKCISIPGKNLLGKILMKIRIQQRLGIDHCSDK